MNETIKTLAKENNPAIQGIITSIIVIIAGVFPKDFKLQF